MLALIIYLIGVMATFILAVSYTKHKYKELTINDVGVILLISIFSWLGFIVSLFKLYGDIVIFKFKK